VGRHNVRGEREENTFAPSASFEYDYNDSSLVYISWARGFKSGGYDVRSNVAPGRAADGSVDRSLPGFSVDNPFAPFSIASGSFEYAEEEAETIEAGLKTTLLNGNLELNVAAFQTDYEDLQVSIFDGTLGFNVTNAGAATSKGIEIDGRWALNENLSFSGALAWLDFEFTDFEDGQCIQSVRIARANEALATGGDIDITCDYAGLSNQYVADLSGYFAADYETLVSDSLLFRATADILFTTDYNPSQNLDPNIEQDGYAKFNLRLALSDADNQWEVAVIGKNLTDENIVTYANDTPLSTSLTQSVGYYGFVESPRTLSFQGTYRF